MFDSEKSIFENIHWGVFVFVASFFWVLYITLMSILGNYTSSFSLFFVVMLIIGLVQIGVGIIFTIRSGFEIIPKIRPIIGSLLLGILNAYTIGILLYLFSFHNIEIFTISFFIALSLFSQVFMERILSGGRGVAVISLITIFLGFYVIATNFGQEIFNIPQWFLLILTIPLASIIGEVVNRKISSTASFSQWVHYIWSGTSVVIIGLLGIAYGSFFEVFNFNEINYKFFILSALASISVIIFMFGRQRTYMAGGIIAHKKIYILVSFLSMSLIASLIFGTVIGVVIIGAFSLIVALFLLR